MPRVVAFSDTHGNLPALQAVWADIQRRKPDHVWCLGDLVAFGPQPSETLDFLLEEIRPTALIRGNTDRYICDSVWEQEDNHLNSEILSALAWTAEKLGPKRIARLKDLAADCSIDVDGVKMYLCHGSPGDDEHGILRDKLSKHAKALEAREERAVLCGHTHLPFRSQLGKKNILNVGSVGFPFDRDFRPCYLSFFVGDGMLQELSFCRVAYGRALVLSSLAESGMPGAELLIHRLRTSTFGAPRASE